VVEFTELSEQERGEVVWTPDADRLAGAALNRYARWLEQTHAVRTHGYADLWRWSVQDVGRFWSTIWEYFDVIHSAPPTAHLVGGTMPDVGWFPGARLNYAENALRWRGPQEAVFSWDETGRQASLSRDELRDHVARAAAGLARLGVGPGDRVAGYLPNLPETLIAMLAAASLGAVWSCCPPEYGGRAVLDRFQQIRPTVLIACDGYVYRGRTHDRRAVVAEIVADLGGVPVVWVPRLADAPVTGGITWTELLAEPAEPRFEQVPFDAPLWTLYSSGSTGLPKGIVHSHGGVVIEHLKSMALQIGIGEGTRAFQYTSSGWVMWNIHVGGLLVGATVLLYDGAADYPRTDYLWEMVATHRAHAFGTSPAYLGRCIAAGATPAKEFDLSGLVTVGSTGSLVPREMYHWVFENVSRSVFLRSTSGGTDVCTSILGCAPTLPTRAGEIQCPPLGVAAAVFDGDGRRVVGEPGELVVTAPMPSMPVALWGDTTRQRLTETYFSRFPGIWRHGDWVTIHADGGSVVHGRSDATLNRGGIRIGTAELYRVLDATPWIRDCVVVDVPLSDGRNGQSGEGSQLVLLVVAANDGVLDSELPGKLRAQLAAELSPRHIPDRIVLVADLPRTINGKRLEVPIKSVLMGRPARASASPGAVSRYEALEALERRRGWILGYTG
jgi:acetoacetyl-CoA synthetase